MALSKDTTAAVISRFGANAADTGNSRVQIALMTERIKQLTDHCKRFPKDAGSNRALLKVVGQRRKMLKYYEAKNLEGYRALIKELGLRK